MPDPTEPVIIATFGVAFGIFALSSAFQNLTAPKPPPDEMTRPLIDEPTSSDGFPYQTPALVGPPAEPQAGRVVTGFYRPFDLLGMGFIYVLFFYVAMGSASASGKKDLVPDAMALATSIAFQFVIAGIVTIFVIGRIRPVAWLGLKWPSWPWIFLIAPAAVISMLILIGGLQVAGLMDWIESMGVETVQDTVQLLQKSDDPWILGLMTFAAVVAAPLCEEIVFRGYFYAAAKKFAGPWAAGLCSALVFTAAHGSLSALLPLLMFGVLLAFIYEKTGSIWAPIAVHCCFNGTTVITQLLERYHLLPEHLST